MTGFANRHVLLAMAIPLLALVFPALAQTWPNKPVKVIVSNLAGGSPDIVARGVLADRFSKAFGQNFVVENIAGGQGVVGAQTAARASPDGYTLYFGTVAMLVTNEFMIKSLPYNPSKDFDPIAMVVDSAPFVIAVNPDVPINSVSELLTAARAQPGKLNYATDSPRGFAGVAGELLKKMAGVNVTQVPYRNVGLSIQDTAANRTQLIITAFPQMRAFITAGKLRPIGVTGPRRFPDLPDVAAVAETIPGYRVDGWFALVGPAGIPMPVVQRLNAEVDRILAEPEVVARLRGFGFTTSGAQTPKAVADFMRTERERWRKILVDVGIEAE